MNSKIVGVIRNHSLDTISFCLEELSCLIGGKPCLLRCIKLRKVIYILENNGVPPEDPQSKGVRVPVGVWIVFTTPLLGQTKVKTIAC